jgi:Glucose / Sorbosone dehydrogenase
MRQAFLGVRPTTDAPRFPKGYVEFCLALFGSMSCLFNSVREGTRVLSYRTTGASLMVARVALAMCGALLAVLLFPAGAAATPSLQPVGTFDSPVYVAAAPGDTHRLFVVERAGRVRIVKDGVVLSTPFLDISSRIDTSRSGGLLSIAFPPNYSSTGRFYGYYTDSTGIRVAEFRRSSKPDRAQAGSPRILLTQPRPTGDHFGGQLQFGPDGLLYIAIGDGQDASTDAQGAGVDAQNLGSWWGKILRINPLASKGSAYQVPATNPFVGTPGAKPEIWAYGLRNPWRFSFDRLTGDLAIGDVGQSKVDEVDFAPNANGLGRGANYGWNCLEGTQLFAPANCTPVNPVPPVLEKQHPATAVGGWCSYSITGGYVVRDPSLPSLNGRYLYGDFCTGEVRSVHLATPSDDAAATDISLPTLTLGSFGEDVSGHVYVVSLAGAVFRVVEST